jgi:membrane protein required for colicin V production
MNYIDLILGVLLFLAAIRGLNKGLVAEIASLAALMVGIWGALRFSHLTADYLVELFNFQSKYMGLISFFVTFVLIVVAVQIIGNLVDKLVSSLALGFINRLAGIVFGVLKTALILSVVLIVFDEVDENVGILPPEKKAESRIYEPVKNLVPSFFPFLDFWNSFDYFDNRKENQNQARLGNEDKKVV